MLRQHIAAASKVYLRRLVTVKEYFAILPGYW